jgi:hypothetical protein
VGGGRGDVSFGRGVFGLAPVSFNVDFSKVADRMQGPNVVAEQPSGEGLLSWDADDLSRDH